MKVSRIFALTLGAAAIALANGCSKPETGDADAGYLTIKGSDTMVHLVSNWAETYMSERTGTDVSVTGGGSGTGIASLINGTTDIAMASRDMKQKERDLAAERGILVDEITVARDGIAIVIHPNNPVTELTLKQLGDMFAGEITNWSKVGGPDQPITLLSRESSSGTYVFVQERVLEKRDYAAAARLMPATSGIIQAVSTEEWSIGYVGLGYALEAGDGVKTLGVKEDGASAAVPPSAETVQSGVYPIARPLYLYTRTDADAGVRDFVEFCLGPEGQRIVSETGYVPAAQGS